MQAPQVPQEREKEERCQSALPGGRAAQPCSTTCREVGVGVLHLVRKMLGAEGGMCTD